MITITMGPKQKLNHEASPAVPKKTFQHIRFYLLAKQKNIPLVQRAMSKAK
jgi:hypothetical protein